MQLERFLAMVEQCQGGGTLVGELQRDEAERTCRAVLSVIAARLSEDDRRRIERELPRELAGAIRDADVMREGATLSDAIACVAKKLGVDEASAERRVCCVLGTLRAATADETWRALPPDVCALGAEDLHA